MIIAVDFDGTLLTDPRIAGRFFPFVGKQRFVHKLVLMWVQYRQRKGDKIIIWTCREGAGLMYAQEWAKSIGFVPDGWNYESNTDLRGFGRSRKLLFDRVIDDRQVGLLGWILRLSGHFKESD